MVGSEGMCSLQAEGSESQGARVSREKEHVSPCVFWIPSLYGHVERSRKKLGEGLG